MPSFIKKLSFVPLISIPFAGFILVDKLESLIIYILSAISAFILLYSIGFALDKLDCIHHNSKVISSAALAYLKQHPLDTEVENPMNEHANVKSDVTISE